ncbi:hypothetical protein [Stenotrophomonas sp.]|uniref:hypothetical protein n=1 Tax=Stenotrophomonas sp. TaxID=69392 RepID=UPI0028AA8331|nr:hypothetical protein [Stenotrophomonas sp.]
MTIFNDLLEKVVEGMHRPIPEMELRRIEKKAEALKGADYSGWFDIRSAVAALRGNYIECDQCFENALRHSDEKSGTVMRYLILCGGLGRNERLKEQFERFAPLLRNDPTAIRHVASLLVGAGYVASSKQFSGELLRLKDEERDSDICSLSVDIVDDSTDGNGNGIKEDAVAQVVSFVHGFLRARGGFPNSITSSIVQYEDGNAGLHYRFQVETNSEGAADLEWAMFEALAEKEFEAEVSGALSFSVVAGGP